MSEPSQFLLIFGESCPCAVLTLEHLERENGGGLRRLLGEAPMNISTILEAGVIWMGLEYVG